MELLKIETIGHGYVSMVHNGSKVAKVPIPKVHILTL